MDKFSRGHKKQKCCKGRRIPLYILKETEKRVIPAPLLFMSGDKTKVPLRELLFGFHRQMQSLGWQIAFPSCVAAMRLVTN